MVTQAPTRLTNPFPGLRPFDIGEEHLFFGREGQSDALLTRLQQHHFLAVVGTSGSGKSSLVRAGLLPALYSGLMGGAGSAWRMAILRPGNAPIQNLAEAFNQPDVLGADAATPDAAIRNAFTETTLRRGSQGIVEVVRQAQMQPHESLLVVVDQFEELFRFKETTADCAAQDEAAAFVKLLLEACQQRVLPIYVVLTMRSDFLGDCAQFCDLPEALNRSQYLIPRMTRDQLRSAIEGPVVVSGASITPRLVNCLLNETGDNPDELPVLQHALMRTWNKWVAKGQTDQPLDLPHYEAMGGMQRALSRHADEVYNGLKDAEARRIAETLFKCLTEKSLDNREIRRPTRLEEIVRVTEASLPEVCSVVDAFRAPHCSLLMPPAGKELTPETTLDISHESLIRLWTKLRRWLKQEFLAGQFLVRLAEDSALYEKGKTGLIRDPKLAEALRWREGNCPNAAWAQRYTQNFDSVVEFLEKSIQAQKAELQKEEEMQQLLEKSRQRNLKMLWLSIVSLVLLLGLASISAVLLNANRAEQRRRNLRLEETTQQLEQSKKELDEKNNELKQNLISLEETKGRLSETEAQLAEANKAKLTQEVVDLIDRGADNNLTAQDLKDELSQKGITQQDAKTLIQEWISAKPKIFRQPFDSNLVAKLLTGERYEKTIGAQQWLEDNNAYYEYSSGQVVKVNKFTSSESLAFISVDVAESYKFYSKNRVAESKPLGTSRWEYTLEKEQDTGDWKISTASSG